MVRDRRLVFYNLLWIKRPVIYIDLDCYIAIMSLLKPVVCALLVLALAGCSVSKNPNPMIRYGANTAATLATPGLVVAGADAHGRLHTVDPHLLPLELVALTAAGVGYVTGALLGGTVGFFKWMINGFENDNLHYTGDLPESVMPPEEEALAADSSSNWSYW